MGSIEYSIGGHYLDVKGEHLCNVMQHMENFTNFVCSVDKGVNIPYHIVEEANEAPAEFVKIEYKLYDEGVDIIFGTTATGYRLQMFLEKEHELNLCADRDGNTCHVYGQLIPRLLSFAIWMGYGLMTIRTNTVLIHTSCIVCHNRAMLFLGESGTGKSTHTRLWRECIEGAHLLNDDSPIIRVEGDQVWAYGSPWSGKTPCYRTERFEMQAFVRLSQAPYNKIQQLPVLKAYAALHPSCPPAFAYDDHLYDSVSDTISKILSHVNGYKMECLPDHAAAKLSHKTIFSL